MRHDIKELIGVLMRVAWRRRNLRRTKFLDLEFEADGELVAALNEAYMHLLEFVHDRELRYADRSLDQRERSTLQESLNKILGIV